MTTFKCGIHGIDLRDSVIHTWPSAWIEAAVKAGLARKVGDGQCTFGSDAMRDALAVFAETIISEHDQYAERYRWLRECKGPVCAGVQADDYPHESGLVQWLDTTELDEAIDKALASSPTPSGAKPSPSKPSSSNV